ncbi:MAG TPA: PIN domain-containing protein [Terriglobales bacterium]|jgi:predicted nucleic acid-binding protein
MNARYFLDTNLFVYTFDGDAPSKAKKALQLIQRAVDSGLGVVSYQVVQEFFNVALRRFPQPLTVTEAEQYLMTVFRPLLAVQSSLSLYYEALRLSEKYHFSWYDSLIVAAALEAQCAILYSEDLLHGRQIESLKIENPFK